MNRVVITGLGALSPNGNGYEAFVKNTLEGQIGIKPITKFDAADTGISVAGQIDDFNVDQAGGKKLAKRMDLFSQYALAVCQEAYNMAGLDGAVDPEDFGVIWGSGIGGLTTIQDQVIKMHDKGPKRVSPLFIPMAIANMAAGNISIRFNAQKISTTVVTACASATNAIGEAYRYVKEGRASVVMTGGSEASLNKTAISGFAALTALSAATDPLAASLPFDKKRNGFVLGEGAGALVLEDLSHAQARGAKIYGEIVGYGVSSDAYHITSPNPAGLGAARAMKLALKDAQISPDQVGYINAHGTATHANDEGESRAIRELFGKNNKVLVSSTKGMTGHLLGAAGAVEAVITAASLAKGILPVNVGASEQDPACDVTLVREDNRRQDVKYALSNSFGFGGHNAVLALKKWEG
ncbi:3-oxoacyl-[acyl-carrier-protein] synthase 2 [Lactobacillus equicursoris 66c]|uniref:3-oxoacyl-[acyl-carrier-protein] synthase 2 n=1 Tax=Lactobacillus equicursoris 66c TaxID=872326 RepID=K0NSV8_9LACO|nr:beta-ketoacyl-ACP synthase II [Lactobacillus equicursoris]CCK84258.1 3-oxoacyl-[acyl-carrier-protein] synthase 2 [Lactobacillus equicursoris 66c]